MRGGRGGGGGGGGGGAGGESVKGVKGGGNAAAAAEGASRLRLPNRLSRRRGEANLPLGACTIGELPLHCRQFFTTALTT